MQNLLSLIADHDAVDAMADKLVTASRNSAPGADECRDILDGFARQFAAHDAVESGLLDDVHALDQDDAFAAAVLAFREEFPKVTAYWTAYYKRWTQAAIAADPDGFAQETGTMMKAIKDRIEWEYTVLYPVALDTGHIALRPER